MKKTLIGLVGLTTIAATSAAAEPRFQAQVQITTADQVVASFTLTETYYGVSETDCVTRVREWSHVTGPAFIEGTEASIAATCAPMDAIIVAKADM